MIEKNDFVAFQVRIARHQAADTEANLMTSGIHAARASAQEERDAFCKTSTGCARLHEYRLDQCSRVFRGTPRQIGPDPSASVNENLGILFTFN